MFGRRAWGMRGARTQVGHIHDLLAFVVIPRVPEAENLVLSRGALDGDTYIHPYMSHVHQTRKHIHTTAVSLYPKT